MACEKGDLMQGPCAQNQEMNEAQTNGHAEEADEGTKDAHRPPSRPTVSSTLLPLKSVQAWVAKCAICSIITHSTVMMLSEAFK